MIAWSVVLAVLMGPTFCWVADPILPLRRTTFSNHAVGSLALTRARVPWPDGRSSASMDVMNPIAIGVAPE